jgi:hypothetical protein
MGKTYKNDKVRNTVEQALRNTAEKALRAIALIRLAPARSDQVAQIQIGLLTTELALADVLGIDLKKLRKELEEEVRPVVEARES